jgi:PAS domain S-box-containing protein
MKSKPEFIHTKQSTILDDLDIGMVAVNRARKITFANRAAAALLGLDQKAMLGRQCCEAFGTTETCFFHQTMETGKTLINKVMDTTNAAGLRLLLSVTTALLRNSKGAVSGCYATLRDLSTVGEMYNMPLQFMALADNLPDAAAIEKIRWDADQQFNYHGIISQSNEMRHVFFLLPRIAESDSTILIEGPSGSGKELIAQTIHKLSHRKNRPIITVNSGALPDTLLESELFGYKAGAFTDAKKDKPGRIALAEGGTLFLDEIGDISPALQVKLLRFLQNRDYEPLGSTDQLRADVRILAATHRNLAQLVRQGKFREDLYYRINVYAIAVPPLERRKEDIPLLIRHFIDHFNRLQKREIKDIASDALNLLLSYDFPGNIRELQNIIERAFILCSGAQITAADLPEIITKGSSVQVIRNDRTLAGQEEKSIREALRRNSGNAAAAADELGIHKTTLWRRMKALGIPAQKNKS